MSKIKVQNWLFKNVDLIFLIAACLLVSTLIRNQVTVTYKSWQMEEWKAKDEKILTTQTRASDIGLLQIVTPGIKPLVADMYWAKAMALNSGQIFEMHKNQASGIRASGLMLQAGVTRSTADSRTLYDLIRVVTRMDPDFEYAYYYGSTLLMWDDQIPLAKSLLEAGMRQNPESGMLSSSLAFLYFYFLKDWKTGAEYAELSYGNSGKYASTSKAVLNLYAAGRNYDMALSFISNALDTVEDEGTKQELENQMGMIMVEKNIDFLQEGVRRFKLRTGRLPDSIEDLVTYKVINALPKEPFGGKYIITEDGFVENEPNIRNMHYKEMRQYQKSIPKGGYDKVL